MEHLNELNEISKDLKKSFEKLEQLQRSFLSDLPNEIRDKVQPIQKDIERSLKAFKRGDINKINEIYKRYANSDTK
jgi:archaellum component FlaC